MKRQIIRVEPLASLLEKYNAPTSTVVRHGDKLYVTGAPARSSGRLNWFSSR